ncbi:MAG: cell division protein FtsB [Gammaproteobacteria bacterium]|nr:cell division protein FtsB [Gammaproteobacteria bacterium]
MRTLIGSLLFLLLLLQGQLWFGQGSLPDLWRLQDAIEQQQDENSELRERNESLAAEVADLKSGLEAIEERARTELGMIREGETFYQVPDTVDAIEVDEPGKTPPPPEQDSP